MAQGLEYIGTRSFASVLREGEGRIVRRWVEQLYQDQRTELSNFLTYEQLIEHIPEIIEFAALAIEEDCDPSEIVDGVRRLRSHAQVRFYQGALIDEVARELMLLRQVIVDFLWQEAVIDQKPDLTNLNKSQLACNRVLDELVAQTLLIYASSTRPPVQTRESVWPPPRRRRTDFR
jgi:RsbT co-antagonist protein rsbRD N-terminal domain